MQDIHLPELTGWNYEERPPLPHQNVGAAWLYMNGSGILGDITGIGKTIQIALLLTILKQRRELTDRAIIVLPPSALLQFRDELRHCNPKLVVEISVGVLPKRQRLERYAQNWDVLLLGFQTMLKDVDTLLRLAPFSLLVADDVDPLRNNANATNFAFRRLADQSERIAISNATPLHNRLHELYHLLVLVGGRPVFGSEAAFKRRYVRETTFVKIDEQTGRRRTFTKIDGYKNLDEFKRLVAPFYLRRTHRDVEAHLPEIAPPNDIWLELYPRQRAAYEELQRGVVALRNDEEIERKRVVALAKITYGGRICAGLQSLGEPDIEGQTSVKLDRLMDMLTGDLAEEKVLVFANNKTTIRAFHERAARQGIGYVTIWGDEPDPRVRRQAQERFWQDPSCMVCIGTSAMERALNLQNSCNLINVDMLLNPARMTQLLGRIRRIGSPHSHVYVHNLLTLDTQEERYLPILERKQALADFIFGEADGLFKALTTAELLALIAP